MSSPKKMIAQAVEKISQDQKTAQSSKKFAIISAIFSVVAIAFGIVTLCMTNKELTPAVFWIRFLFAMAGFGLNGVATYFCSIQYFLSKNIYAIVATIFLVVSFVFVGVSVCV